jgi:hypothetical protein
VERRRPQRRTTTEDAQDEAPDEPAVQREPEPSPAPESPSLPPSRSEESLDEETGEPEPKQPDPAHVAMTKEQELRARYKAFVEAQGSLSSLFMAISRTLPKAGLPTQEWNSQLGAMARRINHAIDAFIRNGKGAA